MLDHRRFVFARYVLFVRISRTLYLCNTFSTRNYTKLFLNFEKKESSRHTVTHNINYYQNIKLPKCWFFYLGTSHGVDFFYNDIIYTNMHTSCIENSFLVFKRQIILRLCHNVYFLFLLVQNPIFHIIIILLLRFL